VGFAGIGAVVIAVLLSAPGFSVGQARTNRGNAPVRLALPHSRLRAGQVVQVGIVNRAAHPIYYTSCFLLQLRDGDGWKTIDSTHGISDPCTTKYGGLPQNAHSRSEQPLVLYDDLQPGVYRITLRYKFLPKHYRTADLRGHLRTVRAELNVLKFAPGLAPHLGERRIKRTALNAAAGAGDPHPSSIQHAEGTRFAANLPFKDLVFDWSWAYLIAIRGHFTENTSEQPVHGSVLTIVLNARTGRVEDFGVSDRYPNLAKVGKVITDYRH
jgi:hypothetical protein